MENWIFHRRHAINIMEYCGIWWNTIELNWMEYGQKSPLHRKLLIEYRFCSEMWWMGIRDTGRLTVIISRKWSSLLPELNTPPILKAHGLLSFNDGRWSIARSMIEITMTSKKKFFAAIVFLCLLFCCFCCVALPISSLFTTLYICSLLCLCCYFATKMCV